MVAALQVLRIMQVKGKPLSELVRCWTRFPQQVSNVRVREKKPFEQMDGVLTLVSEAEALVQPAGGRVLLRYSGTEPKARLLIVGFAWSDITLPREQHAEAQRLDMPERLDADRVEKLIRGEVVFCG